MGATPSADACPPSGGLGRLYREQERRIYRLCLAYLKNGADAEDATQEAFLRASRFLDQLSGDPTAYLSATARNICCDELRRRARAADTGPSRASSAERADDAESVAITRTMLGRAWRQLQPHEREHILYSFAGYSYDEMSRRSGLSVTAVASIVSRARQRARRAAEGAASAVLPVGLCRRTWSRVSHAASGPHATAVGILGAQQGALLVATITGLVAGGAAMPSQWPTQHLATASLSAGALRVPDSGDVRAAGRGSAAPSVTGDVDAGRSTTAGPTRSGSSETSPPSLIGGVLSPPPAQQSDTAFTDVEPSPDYQRDGTIFASGNVLAGCQQASCPALFHSTDRGTSWHQVRTAGFQGGRILLSPQFSVDRTLFAVAGNGVFKSIDGGHTFVLISPLTGPAAVAPGTQPGRARLVLGVRPLLIYDAELSLWSSGPILPSDLTQVDDVAFAGGSSHAVVTGMRPDPAGSALQDGVVVDCATACREVLVTPHDSAFHVEVSPQFVSDQTYLVNSPAHVYMSRDGGATVSEVPAASDIRGSMVTLSLYPDFAVTHRLLATAYTMDSAMRPHPFVALSTDGGSTFTTTSSSGLPPEYLLATMVILSDGHILGALSGPDTAGLFGLRCSTDGSQTWRLTC